MTVTTRTERVTAPSGGEFDVHVFVPEDVAPRGPVPGVLLLQEIYGVDAFLRSRATLLAGLGYAAACPDVFWRVQRNVSLEHDEAALAQAFEHAGNFAQIPPEVTIGDLRAALGRLRTLPEVDGRDSAGRSERARVGLLGYCLGGRLAFELAAADVVDACVSYYGSGIAAELDLAGRITCPILFHFGGSDPYIPREDVDRIAAAFADRPDAEVVVQEGAGHAFENAFAPAFSDPEAAAASWPVTQSFLERTLAG